MVTAIFLGIFVMQASGGSHQALDVYAGSPHYWQYKGEPVLLLGGSVEDNLFQIPGLGEHLDTLVAAGGNYVRCTMSSRDEGNAWPFAKEGRSFNLDQWNSDYWLRFATFLEETRRRDVVVQIELWATFDFYRDNWARNPFNPRNNVNYTAEDTGLPIEVASHPVKAENSFFRSVPAADGQAVILQYQQRFVDRLLAYSLSYEHVLYCMDNETSVTPEWGAYWAQYVRRAGERAGRKVHVTEMWDPHDLNHPMHRATFDHPETYTFVDVSQNNHQKGRLHYDRALAARAVIGRAPRPMNNVKIYGADGARFGDTRDGIDRFWRNIFCGMASARFHRPPSGVGLSERAQRMIRSARDVTDAFAFYRCRPRPDLLSDQSDGEAYCLAEAGRQYAVYFTDGGEALLDLKDAEGLLDLRWYDIEEGRWGEPTRVKGGGRVRLDCPGTGRWAVVVR